MTHICFEAATGRILYTVDGDEHPDTGDGDWITIVPDPEQVFNPARWQVIDGQIVPLAPDLAARRALMKCSRLQGRIVLGEAVCAQIDAMAANPNTFWIVRETITNAIEWSRTSETMELLGWAMGYTDAQMDALFDAAMQVSV
jgi:hypothetical protein